MGLIKNNQYLVHYAQEYALRNLKNISKRSSREYQQIDNPKKVVFNLVWSHYAETTYNELGIMKALQYLGHKPECYICGRKMFLCSPIFDMSNYHEFPKWHEFSTCTNCYDFGKRALEICDIPYKTYSGTLSGSRYLNPPEGNDIKTLENYIYKDINIGKHAKDSTLRFFKGKNPDKTNFSYHKILEQRFINAMKSVDMAEYSYKNDKPDVLFMVHGCYSEWGPFLDYFKKHNIKTVVWGYTFSSKFGNANYIFNFNNYHNIFPLYVKKKKRLSEEEIEQVYSFIHRREEAKSDTKIYNFDPEEKLSINFSDTFNGKVYAMFPNVPWDSSLTEANNAFSSVYDWVDTTINYFKEHKEHHLIIKIHPAESTVDFSFGTIKEYIDDNHILTDNITILDTDTKISAYSLFNNIDVGLVYNGTVGLEMSVRGIPVIMAGVGRYSNCGFTTNISTKKEYLKAISNPPLSVTPKQLKLAEMFAYFYFIKSVIPRTYVIHKNKALITFPVKRFEELLEHTDVKKICKIITEDIELQDL